MMQKSYSWVSRLPFLSRKEPSAFGTCETLSRLSEKLHLNISTHIGS